jgi:hypothetical protein
MTTPAASKVVKQAYAELGHRYLLGTEGPNTFDCSGLIWYIFNHNGYASLIGGSRRRAAGYTRWFADHGEFTTNFSAMRFGDLIVYENPVGHIGIYVGNGYAISALIQPYGVTRHRWNHISVTPRGVLRVSYPGGVAGGTGDDPTGGAGDPPGGSGGSGDGGDSTGETGDEDDAPTTPGPTLEPPDYVGDTLRLGGSDLHPIKLPTFDRTLVRPVSMAYDGQIGSGSVFVREADYSIYSGRRIELWHGDAILAGGFVGAQMRTRPGDDALIRGDTYTWQDNNLLLSHRRIEYWDRGTETDVNRVLAAMAEFCPDVGTDTYVSDAITIGMPAKTYQDTFLDEVFADAMDQTAKTWFTDRERQLHFHGLNEDVGFNASISITDESPDRITSFPPGEPRRNGDPYNLSNDLKVVGTDGTSVIVQDAPSIDQHNSDGLVFQDTVNYPDSSDTGTLEAYGVAVLATRAQDRVTYQVTLYYLPDPTVLEAGMRILTTSAVLGVSAEWLRISQLAWETPAPNVWIAHLELAQPVRSPWELRHRRKPKKPPPPPEPPGDATVTEDSALTLDVWQLKRNNIVFTETRAFVGTLDATDHTFTYSHAGGAATVTVGSAIEGEILWPWADCGGLMPAWTGETRLEIWGEIDLSGGLPDDWLGIRVDGQGAGWVADYATLSGATPIADQMIYAIGWGLPDPTAPDEFTTVATVNLFEDWSVFIPRNLLVGGVDNALVIAPTWLARGWFCQQDLDDPGPGENRPAVDGSGDSARAHTAANQLATLTPVVLSGSGKSPWVPGDGAIDGSNATFALISWDGSGTPEARVDGIVVGAADYTFDAGALTVTLREPPATGAQVAFRYNVGA